MVHPVKELLQVHHRGCRLRQPRALRFTSRATSFVADGFTRGFTARCHRPRRFRGHLTQCWSHRHGLRTRLLVWPFVALLGLLGQPSTTATSADFSLQLTTVTLSGTRRDLPRSRTHSFAAQPPDLRRLTFDHESFAVSCPLALVATASYPVRIPRLAASLHASSPQSVAPLPVALRFVRCDQLTTGLSPARVRPCWAHMKRAARRRPFDASRQPISEPRRSARACRLCRCTASARRSSRRPSRRTRSCRSRPCSLRSWRVPEGTSRDRPSRP